MKLSTRVICTKEVAKSLRIGTSKFEIEAKEEDCTTADTKDSILLLRTFHIYAQILILLATLSNKLKLQLAWGKYV